MQTCHGKSENSCQKCFLYLLRILHVVCVRSPCVSDSGFGNSKTLRSRYPLRSIFAWRTIQIVDQSKIFRLGSSQHSIRFVACREDMSSNSSKELADIKDKFFRNEPARRAYHTFRKYTVLEGTETSIFSIAPLNALMATVEDSLNTRQ